MTHPDPVEQLRQALAITPSAEFAARVRQRVSTQPARATWWSTRHFATAAAAVFMVSLAVVQWSRSASPDVRFDRPMVPAAPAVPGVTPAPSSPAPHGGAPGPITRRTSPVVVASTVDVFAETLVPDDQRLALERLLGAIREGRAIVPAVVADDLVDEEGRRLPRALLIEPLKLELLAGTPAEPNKDPVKESVK